MPARVLALRAALWLGGTRTCGPMPRVVRIGNGAGYQGDRIPPAVELVRHGSLDFLFLECLAERTLATAHRRMSDGGTGYDSRLADWMEALLPIAHERGVRIVTNMGAADPEGGGRAAAEIAARLGLPIKVAACGEVLDSTDDSGSSRYTYLGADVVKQALDSGADFVITGRVADPSLLVGCVAHAFNWDLADGSRGNLDRIARATAAGHLLECGQQLTGGYFAHPRGRDMGWEALRHISQPMADLDAEGNCILRKLSGSGGELSPRSCAQQLIYEVGDPAAYLTPDCAADFTAVNFRSLSADAVQVRGACAGVPVASGGIQRTPTLLRLHATRKGVKQSAEFSVGGSGCMQRGVWADRLVRQWMEEAQPFSTKKMMTYFQGWNALCVRPRCTQNVCLPSGTAALPSSRHLLLTTGTCRIHPSLMVATPRLLSRTLTSWHPANDKSRRRSASVGTAFSRARSRRMF